MATSKAQALAKISAEDERAMASMRERIELAILRYDGTFPISVTPTGSRKAIERIADEYRAVGWTVEYGSDQRDGAWLTLK